MEFDACDHKIRQLVIRAGTEFRRLQGKPDEKNISILFNEAAPILGVLPVQLSSANVNHLPAPHEMRKPGTNIPIVPVRDCPHCNKTGSFRLDSICPSCSDSEGGKFHTMWFCGEMDRTTRELIPGTGCGAKDKSDRFYMQWLNELVPDWQSAMKQDAGIRTVTDEGIK